MYNRKYKLIKREKVFYSTYIGNEYTIPKWWTCKCSILLTNINHWWMAMYLERASLRSEIHVHTSPIVIQLLAHSKISMMTHMIPYNFFFIIQHQKRPQTISM